MVHNGKSSVSADDTGAIPLTASSQTKLPTTINGETLPLRADVGQTNFDAIDALARLTVGSAADLSDILLTLLEQWEQDIVQQQTATIAEDEEDLGDLLRYLLVGIIFESQRSIRSTAKGAGSLVIGAATTTAAVTRPIRNSWLFGPMRSTTEKLANGLESRVAALVNTGRSEEFVGRLMAEHALEDTVDWTMDYIAQNPQIRDLVQQQALGFTEEITVGIRERTITADNIFDNLLRKILRRTPRPDLPGPPDAVRRVEQDYSNLERGSAV